MLRSSRPLRGRRFHFAAAVAVAVVSALGAGACTDARPIAGDGGVQTTVHPLGILDPLSPDFHGNLLRAEKYDFALCQKCHGDDFSGGTSGKSCLRCHAEGPTACSTCHGHIGASGSHQRHVAGGPLGKTFGCAECHKVPAAYTDVGHIFLADGSLDPAPAEVTLGATAALTPAGATRTGPPAWDEATQTCTNVYCHGAVLAADGAATNTHPAWNAPGTGQADCGSCHGLPPNHSNNGDCAMCHASVVGHDRQFLRPDLHINGTVELADTAKNCSGCHGGASGPAPPADLAGNTERTALGVGAHQAHLHAGVYAGPIACSECHRVPVAVDSPGHFGGHAPGEDVYPAEVFPADVTVGVLASADGASPVWDRPTATCAGVYCHGVGDGLAAELTAGVSKAPLWTSTSGLTCGSACHGAPPVLPPHNPGMTRTDCTVCHPRTVDPTGNIIIAGPPGAETSAHVNGAVDVAP
jgi:predicted CxxxxCH...CXXCH cytochrome family protein